MKSTLEIINEVYYALSSGIIYYSPPGKPSQGEFVTGGIFKLQRPDNSTEEDIVISALPVSDGTPDRCTVNVNIYVPDMSVTINGRVQYQPDYTRLKTISEAVISLLDEIYRGYFSFYISSQAIYKEASINQHFSNIRIEYSSFQ
jgi:hypothetical protein